MWKADQPDLQSANMGPKGPQSAQSGEGERARVLSRLRADMRSLCREELAEHRRVLRQQRAVVPPPVGRVYPRIPGQTENQTSEYLQEFFSNLLGGDQEVPQGFVYNMDSDTSDLSQDSGNQSINLD